MELSQAMRQRRSVRAFTGEDVPDERIREIIDAARWAPSWANAQGWNVAVVRGERLLAVKAMLAERFAQEAAPDPDVRMPQRGEWPAHVAERMTYRRPAPGAAPEPPRRPGLSDLYGATALLIFTVDERLALEYACFDLGLLVENVCLLAHDEGLGTCIMAMAVRFGGDLHALLPELDGQRIVIGVALGHPDTDSDLNRTDRSRCPLDDVVTTLR